MVNKNNGVREAMKISSKRVVREDPSLSICKRSAAVTIVNQYTFCVEFLRLT